MSSRINISIDRDIHTRFALLLSVLEIETPLYSNADAALTQYIDSKRDEVAMRHPTFLPRIFPAAAHADVSTHPNIKTQTGKRLPKTGRGKPESRISEILTK